MKNHYLFEKKVRTVTVQFCSVTNLFYSPISTSQNGTQFSWNVRILLHFKNEIDPHETLRGGVERHYNLTLRAIKSYIF